MNLRLLGLTLLGMLIVAGLIAGTFARAIEHALTTPASHGIQLPIAKNTTPAPTTGTSTTPVTVATVPAGVLAQDTFQRADQTLWGTSADGRMWSGDANNVNSQNIFSIAGMTGIIAHGQGAFNALLGSSDSNVEVMARGSVNHFNKGVVNLGVVLRWTDTNNWYKFLIDGTNCMLLKRVNGVTTQLATVPFQAQGERAYTLRFRAVGTTLFAKAWPSDGAEPGNWMLVVSDMTFASGQPGIRVLIQNDTIVRITSFLVMAANSGM